MVFRILADLTVVTHLAFVAFVVFGGLLVWRWRWVAWIHVPAVAWAVGVEWTGEVCPLTPLENWFRARAGLSTYGGDFLGRHVYPILYPTQLTRGMQAALGGTALVWNGAVYALWWRRRSGRRL